MRIHVDLQDWEGEDLVSRLETDQWEGEQNVFHLGAEAEVEAEQGLCEYDLLRTVKLRLDSAGSQIFPIGRASLSQRVPPQRSPRTYRNQL
jgi:hypothetical protein